MLGGAPPEILKYSSGRPKAAIGDAIDTRHCRRYKNYRALSCAMSVTMAASSASVASPEQSNEKSNPTNTFDDPSGGNAPVVCCGNQSPIPAKGRRRLGDGRRQYHGAASAFELFRGVLLRAVS